MRSLDRPSRRHVVGLVSALLLPIPAEAMNEALWPPGKAGAVSLTYDDGLDSQLDLAVPALDRFGFKATFFLTFDNIKRRLDEWAALAKQGHELANHTVTHPCNLEPFSAASYRRRELAPMARWLDRADPREAVRSFAYPCDVTNFGAGDANRQEARFDRLLSRMGIAAARTSEGEPNRPTTALRRPHRLQALAVGFDATDFAAVDAYLDRAVTQGYWAILVFHDLAAVPSAAGQTGLAMHAEILKAIADKPLWCAPMASVFDWIRRRA
ncbi:MAG: polysaccharide deacetylase family protein [Sphingomonas sp.]|nr:polysaccharide deacetylase family protein [Sphingomonas sp.]